MSSFSGYNAATSFNTFQEICNSTKIGSPKASYFSCLLFELPFKLELIGFGYICWSFEALIILISIFGGITEKYKLFILIQAIWDSFIIYDFVCENPSATDGNRGYWVNGHQTKGPSCFYNSLIIIGVILRLLSGGKFQGFEDYSDKILRCYNLFCHPICNSSAFDRCMKVELENYVYNLFDCFPKIFPSIFLAFSTAFSLSLIAKIGTQLKYQFQHKKNGLLLSLKISIICFSQAILLAGIFGISLFSKFPEIYDLGANGGTMWTDVDTFYKRIPLWLNILKEPLTVKCLNIVRILIDSIMILVILKGYRNSCKSVVIWVIKTMKNPIKSFRNLCWKFSNNNNVVHIASRF